MRWTTRAAIAALMCGTMGLSACTTDELAEFSEGLSYVDANLKAQNGQYYEDFDDSQSFGSDNGDCVGRLDFGRHDNRNYFRVANLTDKSFAYTLDFRGGVTVSDTLDPNSSSDIIYKPPTIEWDNIKGTCTG